MHQVKRMHRTLVVLAVGLLALAAPLVAAMRTTAARSPARWRGHDSAREGPTEAFALLMRARELP